MFTVFIGTSKGTMFIVVFHVSTPNMTFVLGVVLVIFTFQTLKYDSRTEGGTEIAQKKKTVFLVRRRRIYYIISHYIS